MKTLALSILLVAGLALPPLQAKDPDKPEMMPYLGVATSPVDPALARHLKLRPGTGLLVQLVDADSAADGVIAEEDILTELDGQLLINPEQFVTLVRLQKPGQEIALKLLREGDAKTVKVKLGEREALREPPPMGDDWEEFFRIHRGLQDNWRQPMPRSGGPGGGQLRMKPEDTGVRVQMHSTSVIVEDGRRAELTDDGSTRHFKVTEKDGKVLFEGDVKGDKDVEKMPKIARELYDRVTTNTKIEIQPPPTPRGNPADRVDT